MLNHLKLRRSVLSSIVAVAMVSSLSFAPTLASAQQGSQNLATGTMSAGVPEWAIDDGGNATGALSAQAAIPSAYDLRTEGLVTPVKFQNPWGSCWAFGGTAAAETSILSAYGSTYEASKLDLSERHLTYFALQPVSEAVNPDQVGEGLHSIAQETEGDMNAVFNAGGQPVYITTLFSQGIGPMLESLYPYRGNNALTSMEYYEQDPQKATMNLLLAQFHTEDAVQAFIAQQAQAAGMTEEQALAAIVAQVKGILEASPTYSDQDDWSIPETNADGTSNRLVSNGMVLKNGNVLPAYWNADKTELQQDGVNAIKQELLNGRGVSIAFYCEQGTTYANQPGGSNKDQAQYVFDTQSINHGVCIVGWDDSYARENFSHELKVAQPDGTEVDRTAETTPPGDGAWIVKNSYGSQTDYSTDDLGNTINKSKWGNLNDEGESTGYFYLSYYDRTIQQTESMEFAADLGADGGFIPLQYDYMPANGGFYTTEPTIDDVTSSANVFDADKDIVVKSVSTRTSETNARVTIAIYLLDNKASIADITPRTVPDVRISRNFEYGGFHRINLDQPLTVKAGQKMVVVSTMSTVDSAGKRHYSATANQGISKEFMESAAGDKAKVYSTAVINEGESFLFKDGKWQDWKDYTNALPASAEELKYLPDAQKYIEASPIDNFSIKVYAEPVDNSQAKALEEAQKAQKDAEAAQKDAEAAQKKAEAAQKDAEGKAATAEKAQKAAEDKATAAEKKAAAAEKKAAAVEKKAASLVKANTMIVKAKTVTAKAKTKTTKKKSQAFSVKKAKGKVTFYKVSGNAKIAVSSKGVVTVKKGLKAKKNYKVKVLVVAAGGKVNGVQYAPAHIPVILTVKVK